MGTRGMAWILKENVRDDGRTYKGYEGLFFHFDGYLSHTGQILLNHYDEAKFNRLLELCGGVVRQIKGTPEATLDNSKDNNEKFEKYPTKKVCLDCLDSDLKALQEAWDREYVYVLKNGKWFYADSDWDFADDGYRMNGLRELTQEAIKEEINKELQEIGGKIAVAIDNAPKAPAVANSISLSKDDKIAGFAVTYLNEYGEDDVEFCDSFEEMLEVQKERESQGHTTKIFIEISDEILQKEKGE